MTRSAFLIPIFTLLFLSADASWGSGADTALYNRDRTVDFLHMRLLMTFTSEDLRERGAEGRVTYELAALAEEVGEVRLDAVGMEILGVELPGEDAGPEASYDDRILTVSLPRPLGRGERIRLAVRYRLRDPELGLHFVLPGPSMPSRRLAVYTHSETMRARYWLPCHDYPNERWTSEVSVTVPSPYTVVANGLLEERTVRNDTVTYVWRSDVPIDPHLLGFVIAELVEVPQGDWHGRPVSFYAHPDDVEAARYTLRQVPEMIGFFAETLGVDYPFPSFKHVVVPDHFHGGMEHAGYSLLARRLTTGPRGEVPFPFVEQNYVSHMLAHNWFAGVANYRSAAEAWLNEGFATYLHFLWQGRNYSPEDFESLMWERAKTVSRAEKGGVPLVYGRFDDPEDIYRFDGGKVYWKGAWVVHMLRRELGDELFWSGVGKYLRDHESVESGDLRRALEEVSGRDLERFFAQWVHGSGFPRLDVSYTWNDGKADDGKATVHVEQSRAVDEEAPLFAFPLDLYFRVGESDVTRRVEVSGPVHDFAFGLDAEPSQFAVDPGNKLLKIAEVSKPFAYSLAQLRHGPTATSRMDAADHLAGLARPGAVEALAGALADGGESWVVRARAAEALGRMDRSDALRALLRAYRSIEGPPRVEAAVLDELGRYPYSREAHELLLLRLPAPESDVYVETAAVEALGGMRSSDELMKRSQEALRQAVSPATRRWVRRSALHAMRRLDEPALFDVAADLVRPDEELRGEAIAAVGALGRHKENRDRARKLLFAWLDDEDRDTQAAAVRGLRAFGGAEAIAALGRVAESGRRRLLREAAAEAAADLRQKRPSSAWGEQIRALEEKNEELERTLWELRERVEKLEASGGGRRNPNEF